MSVSALNTLINPLLRGTTKIPTTTVKAVVTAAIDGNAVTSGESRVIFDLLRRRAKDGFSPADEKLLAKTATQGMSTAADFNAASFSERRRVVNSVLDTRTDRTKAGTLSAYKISKAVSMPTGMTYTEALKSVGFPEAAAKKAAADIASYRRNVDSGATVKARLLTIDGQLASTEVLIEATGGRGQYFLSRFGPDGTQYQRYTPWSS